MGIDITCDICGKSIDFGGNWRRVAGGRVACYPCEELVLFFKELEKQRYNLGVYLDTKIQQGQNKKEIDDVILFYKTFTKSLQNLLAISANEL